MPVRNKTLFTPFLKLKNKTLSRAMALSLGSFIHVVPFCPRETQISLKEKYTQPGLKHKPFKNLQMPGETRTGNLSGRFQIQDQNVIRFWRFG